MSEIERVVDPGSCRRLQGGSVKDCVCRLPNEGGWLPCPPDAQGLLVPIGPAPNRTDGHGAAEGSSPSESVSLELSRPSGEIAVMDRPAPPRLGLTGEMCGECGSFNTRRTGTCIQCLDCYATGGCG